MNPDDGFRRLNDADEWEVTLRPRTNAVPARRKPAPWVVSLATIAAVAVVGVLVFSVFGLGVRSVRQPAVPVVPTSVPSPVTTATCESLLDADVLADFRARGLVISIQGWVDPQAGDRPSIPESILTAGGIACTWEGDNGATRIQYGWGPIYTDDSTMLQSVLVSEAGATTASASGYERYSVTGSDFYDGEYAFGDGYRAWVLATPTLDVDLLAMVVANAPPVGPPLPRTTQLPTAVQTAVPTAVPTSTAAGETVPTVTEAAKPKQVFDGDCSQLYSTDEVSALTGKPMELWHSAAATDEHVDELEFAIEQAGGLTCSWFAEPVDDVYSSSPAVSFVAVPSTAVAPLEKELTCGPGYSESISGPGACGIELEAGGIRFSGGVVSSSAATGKALAAAVIDRLNERAPGEQVTPVAPVEGSWVNPVDCDGLAKKIDVESVFGPDGTFGEDGAGHGTFGPPVGDELTSGYETLTCSASSGGDAPVSSYRFGILGGGGWVRDQLAGSSEVTIDGIGEAYKVGGVLYVFTGPNLLTLEYTVGSAKGDFAGAAEQVRAVVAALGAE